MPTLSQRLRELDRRVLREPSLTDAAGWTKAMSRWKLQLAAALLAAATIPFNLAVGNRWISLIALPTVLLLTFQAGRMHTEYERATGKRTFMGKIRPPGIG